MNKAIKYCLLGMMISAVVPAVAEELGEKGESGAIGWTPVAVSLASPVQLPWGTARWDVFGVDAGIFYNDAPKMYGFQFAFANTVRDEFIGLGLGGAFNFANKDVYGARAAILGCNLCNGTLYGVDIGGFGCHRDIYGIDVEFVATMQQNICGIAGSLVGNVTENESYGCTVGAANLARVAYGAQLALVANVTDELHGFQFGAINFARECPWGFQLGIINIILDNEVKVLPFINGYF